MVASRGRRERPRDYYVIEDEQGRRYWLYREGLYGETGEDAAQMVRTRIVA